jgi:hypothetical protein
MPDLTGSAGRGRLAEALATRGGRAAPEAPFVIEHREALIYMLCQAAELEHGIMCQYLFAAFSLKQRADEGLTPEELEAVTRWRRTIAHVATEEMLHLALVQNVLSAIGAAPHLTRPNLPAPARHYSRGRDPDAGALRRAGPPASASSSRSSSSTAGCSRRIRRSTRSGP